MSVVVQSIVAFELTGENSSVGLVNFARGLAMLALGPIGGAMADRISKRSILIVGQLAAFLVFATLAGLMAYGLLRVIHLAAAGLVVGSTFAFLGPTRGAYAVELVASDRRGNAIALNQIALNASRVIGPTIGGALLALAWPGAWGAFAAVAALYLLAVLLQARLPVRALTSRSDGRGVLADVADGLRHVKERPQLRALLSMFVTVIMLGFPHVTVLPGFVAHRLEADPDAVSVLFVLSAAGGLAASLAVAPFSDGSHVKRVYVVSGFAFGLSLVLLASTSTLATASVAIVVVGLASGTMITLNGAVLLAESEPAFFGRIMSLALLAFAAFSIVGLPVGYLADAIGEAATLAALGGGVCVAVAAWARAALRSSC